MGSVAANLGIVATQPNTVELVAKANVALEVVAQPRHQPQVVVMLAASLAHLFLIKCSSTETMPGAKVMGSISMMLSLLLPDPSMGLVLLEMLLHARRK